MTPNHLYLGDCDYIYVELHFEKDLASKALANSLVSLFMTLFSDHILLEF